MRQLTVLREKTFVGSMAKMKIYVEDPTAPELTINGAPCRKLGDLKNGEEKTFEIPETETRIFAIADKLSKDFCNDCFRLPAGTEPVHLSGKNRYNPGTGNAFRFYDNTDPDMLKNRKRGTRRGVVILAAALAVGIIGGFFLGRGLVLSGRNDPKEFSEQGMHVTLTKAFSQKKVEPYTVSYASRDTVIHTMREDFSLAPGFGDLSLSEYAALVQEGNPQIGQADGPFTWNGFLYYEYSFEDPTSKTKLRYFVPMFRAPDAFWVFNFVAEEERFDELRPQILEWAESVRFD